MAADDIGVQCGGWTTTWQGESGDVQPGTTILEGLKEQFSPETRIGFNATGNFPGIADVGIAVVGEFPYAEGMGDREELSLSIFDQQLIRTLREHSQNLIVVIISGRPLVITEVYPVADAWVAAWLPGTEGNGVTDVLFGDYPFTGQLPYTWPRSNEQLPININNLEHNKGCDSPFFPYGFGLGEAGSKPIKNGSNVRVIQKKVIYSELINFRKIKEIHNDRLHTQTGAQIHVRFMDRWQQGRDPFGDPVRDSKNPAELVRLLGEVGAYGVNFHDNDLIPIDATPAEAEAIKKDFRKALQETGLKVPMATTNLFGDPVFKDGAFTSNDPKVRAYARQKTLKAIDLGVEFGAKHLCLLGRPRGH